MTNIWPHVEHTAAGVILWTAPLLIAGIPVSWTSMTVGGVIGLVWSLVRTYLMSA